MKRLVCPGPGEVAWAEIDLADPKPGEVRVRNRTGAEKHGTMASFFKGVANERGRWDAETGIHRPGEGVLWNYPIPLGNVQVGETEDGRRVAHWGPFQPFANVREEDLREIPASVDWRDAVLLDPAEFALGALRDGGVRIGDRVAVFGLGAIGLVTTRLAKLAGASLVIGLDPSPARRAVSGADLALDSSGDAGLAIREATGMLGVDVAIDFSGARPAFQAALRGVAYGGTIVMGAFPAPWGPGLDLGGEAHMNRPRVVFSRACSDPNPDHPRWDWNRIRRHCHEIVASGRLSGADIVDAPVPFESLPEVYPSIAAAPERSIKLSVVYE